MRASAWRSRAKRAGTSRELSPARTILSATRRRTGPVSAASYTVPIPPSPSTPRIRYGPIVSGAGIGDGRLVVSVMSLTLAFAAICDAAWSCDLLGFLQYQFGVDYELPAISIRRTGQGELIGVSLRSGVALHLCLERCSPRPAVLGRIHIERK